MTIDLLPSAADNMKKIALAEAERASAYSAKQAVAEAEKRELMERLQKPSGVSDEERLNRAAAIIQRAVDNGQTEYSLVAFPTRWSLIAAVPSTKRNRAGRILSPACRRSSTSSGTNI